MRLCAKMAACFGFAAVSANAVSARNVQRPPSTNTGKLVRTRKNDLCVARGLAAGNGRVEGVNEDPIEAFDQLMDASGNLIYQPNTPCPLLSVNKPVYSLSTNAAAGGGVDTMNLVTYLSPMSIQPRHIALGLYRGTQSWTNFLDARKGVVQVLRTRHMPLFDLLGKTSGRDVAKAAAAEDLGFAVARFFGHAVIADCYGYLEVEMVGARPITAGDHDIVVCSVANHLSNAAHEDDVLYTSHLRDAGYM